MTGCKLKRQGGCSTSSHPSRAVSLRTSCSIIASILTFLTNRPATSSSTKPNGKATGASGNTSDGASFAAALFLFRNTIGADLSYKDTCDPTMDAVAVQKTRIVRRTASVAVPLQPD